MELTTTAVFGIASAAIALVSPAVLYLKAENKRLSAELSAANAAQVKDLKDQRAELRAVVGEVHTMVQYLEKRSKDSGRPSPRND